MGDKKVLFLSDQSLEHSMCYVSEILNKINKYNVCILKKQPYRVGVQIQYAS